MKRMLKYFAFICAVTVLLSCGCNDDSFESFELDLFEKNVIPFTTSSDLTYRSSDGSTTAIQATAKAIELSNRYSSDDESCAISLEEYQINNYVSTAGELLYEVRIFKSTVFTSFQITDDDRAVYFIDGYEGVELEDFQETVITNGFQFNDVFTFIPFSTSEVEFILYSTEDGINFIKYVDGSYLILE
ncbi:MAG: hypothetical protein WBA16_00100 [Nonlabens sp.]